MLNEAYSMNPQIVSETLDIETAAVARPGATAGVKWHEIGQAEIAAIAGWTRAVPWPLDREEDEISNRC